MTRIFRSVILTYHGHVANGGEVPDEDVDVDEGGSDGLVPAWRPQPRIVYGGPEDLVQDIFFHLSVVDNLPRPGPVPLNVSVSVSIDD